MSFKKRIIWEHHAYEYLENENRFQVDEDDEVDTFDSEEMDLKESIINSIGTLVKSPFGVFQVDDSMNPYRQFKFWMAHTNFDITNEVAAIIEKTPGVEVFHILTRYRFLIAIGPVFESMLVKHHIQAQLCNDGSGQIEENFLAEKISELKNKLESYPRWCIYVFPNGEFESAFLKTDQSNLQEYEEKLSLYQEAQTISHGQLITNDN